MKKSKLTQALTLTIFVTLIGLFVMYKSGYFESETEIEQTTLQTSANGGSLTNSVQKDSFVKKVDDNNLLLLSSSKSVIITKYKKQLIDTLVKKPEQKKELEIMSSTKSTSNIFKPNIFIFDSLKFNKNK